jgi:hypothetical protein
MRDRLKTASTRLREAGHADSADAVDAVLAPGGWTLLRQQDAPFTTNLPLTMRASLRDQMKKAAEEQNLTLTAVVTEGHRKTLDGTWTPPESRRIVRAGASVADDPRVVLNVTVDDALRKELRDRLPGLSEELGYKLTEGGIAVAYLRHKLSVPQPKSKTAKAE